MTETPGYSAYSLDIRVRHIRAPSSGYFDVAHLMNEITYNLAMWGRALAPVEVTQLTKNLDAWTGDPAKPWTYERDDVSVMVRLTEKFTGWGPNMRPL
jgi:hypothetical protein